MHEFNSCCTFIIVPSFLWFTINKPFYFVFCRFTIFFSADTKIWLVDDEKVKPLSEFRQVLLAVAHLQSLKIW